jgi:hypothetical protein
MHRSRASFSRVHFAVALACVCALVGALALPADAAPRDTTQRVVTRACYQDAFRDGRAAHWYPPNIRFEWLPGFDDPATPNALDRVGVLKIGAPGARNVLVLNPGTSAGAAYFLPLAADIVHDTHGSWQVWSVERRENQLEDQSFANLAKQGNVSVQQAFDYYLGWITNPSVTNHFQLIPDASVSYAKNWGMNVEIEDLHRVVEAAATHGRHVVLGGHSLGGSITTAYATWDFNGRAGADDLDGLVYIDGGSGPNPVSADDARGSLARLASGSPWLAFGGIAAPFAGLFSSGGALATLLDPNSPSLGQAFAPLPAELKPPVPATNEAQYGFALDTKTSPSSLAAAQAHLGQLAATGTPRGWDSTGALTPIRRFATMFSGGCLLGLDGVAWYHPLRLTIDAGAVADGNANPAQSVLDVKAIHGHDLDENLRIYAFGAALGGQGVLTAAQTLAAQSNIPSSNLTLVNRSGTYAHNDPAGASPVNDFLSNLVPFLDGVAHVRR